MYNWHFSGKSCLFPKPKGFASSKKLGESLLLPTRQQDTALTKNQRLLGKGGRKQGEMGSAALKKLCNRERAQERVSVESCTSSPLFPVLDPLLRRQHKSQQLPLPSLFCQYSHHCLLPCTLNRHTGHIKLLL